MSATSRTGKPATSEIAIWQDIEFGSFAADLALWEELADPGRGTTLELGSGSGRVALHLGRRGIPVLGIECDPELAAELARRARAEELPVEVLTEEIAALDAALPSSAPIGAAIAPLHVIQQLEPGDRPALLSALARLLPPGAPVALVVVDERSLLSEGVAGAGDKLPDMRELDGWVYSSEPLWVQLGEAALTVRRLRERVSPGGEIERSVHDELLHRLAPEALEAEAERAGFAPRERTPIRSGPAEADSIVVLLEAP